MKNYLSKSIFLLLVFSSIVLSSCSDLTITGNVVKEFEGTCLEGNIVTKIIKSQEIEMCCFISNDVQREIRSCKSDDFKYSELTIIEQDMITQRKVVYPMNNMTCQDVYGRINELDNLELISDLSSCS